MRLLLLDIETAPNLAYVWSLFKENIPLDRLIDSGYVLCWAAKWYGEDEVMFDSIRKSGAKRMLRRVHKLLDQCDAVIHFNGKSFDIPTLNKEFLLHGFNQPAPYKQIDLYQVASSTFRFTSNKLEHIAKYLGLPQKKSHRGFKLWVGCMENDPSCWAEMEEYNRGDVVTLEAVYNKMRSWIKIHPNAGLYDEPGIPVCPTCGSGNLQRRGYAHTMVGKYARFRCGGCGSWTRSAEQEMDKESRKAVMRRIT